jgi:hypothetical protein
VTDFLALAGSERRDAARGARYAPWRSGAPERRNGAPEHTGVPEFRGLGLTAGVGRRGGNIQFFASPLKETSVGGAEGVCCLPERVIG